MNEIREQALALYTAPFIHVHGYVFDANSLMVTDDGDSPKSVRDAVASRIRGWGRLSYMPDAKALQDEVGKITAEALTQFWTGQTENARLRRLLCAMVSPTAYMDDGEASDTSQVPHIDFKRDTLDNIEHKIRERLLASLRKQKEESK